MFRESQRIGPYTLIRKLGRGGFGEVWLAENRGIATVQVAIKLPLDDHIDHTAVEQEAQLWVRASGHSNILPIIEANEMGSSVSQTIAGTADYMAIEAFGGLKLQ